MISVIAPGLLTTVQDEGRPGYRACGMPVSGALDPYAYAAANLLAGSPPGAAALEMTLLGGTFRFERNAFAAVTGADLGATLDGAAVAPWSSFPVRAGGVLACGSAASGCRAYLAVHGGIDVPPVLGSRSTYARAAVGGLAGRALAAGDVLPVGTGPGAPRPRALSPRLAPRYGGEVRLRAVPGPQDDRFRPEGVATFFASAYKVTNRNDRMGYQLEGPAVLHAGGADIVSDALLPGAVQVPGNGLPIVMMADCQTVGGYAKIATVAAADLPALAQCRLGDVVRFERCSLDDAVEALRRERRRLDALAVAVAGAGP